eukprot:2557990-Pleurochrysis_carterae.AAC.1
MSHSHLRNLTEQAVEQITEAWFIMLGALTWTSSKLRRDRRRCNRKATASGKSSASAVGPSRDRICDSSLPKLSARSQFTSKLETRWWQTYGPAIVASMQPREHCQTYM